jgi:neutral ceramidase
MVIDHCMRSIEMNRLALAAMMCVTGLITAAEPPAAKPESNLRVAVAKLDITPPAGTKVVGHVREVDGVRDPLHAVLLLLDDGTTRAAILSLDLLSCPSDMAASLRESIGAASGTPAANIMVATSHNHSGPGWAENPEWARKVAKDLGEAAGQAAKSTRRVSVGYGEGRIDFNIQRRKVIEGRAVVRLNPEGPCDHRVKVLRFDDGKSPDPVAVMMHAVCHPCVFTWGDKWTTPHPTGFPKMSADFPGEAKSLVEKVYGKGTTAMFLQGCAGDIRPNLPGLPYRCGDEADIRWAGRDLGCAAVKAADRSFVREEFHRRPAVYPIRCATKVVTLPAFKKGETVQCELQAMKVGPYLFLTLPGEPFVEYGFRLEKAIADRAIPIVVGYANGNIGYICTAKAFKEGGYEPNNSASGPEAEEILVAESLKLADRVIGDVFESFSPPGSLGRTDKK